MVTIVEQIRNLRLLKKTAAVYLLFLFLDQPLLVIDVARLLEIDRSTARNHIRLLISFGVIARPKPAEGFTLTGKGRRFLLGEFSAAAGEFPPPITTTSTTAIVNDSDNILYLIKELIKDSKSKESLTAAVVVINKLEEISPGEAQAVWAALEAAGITRNTRTEQLVRQDYLTPDYVTGHYLSLKSRGKGDQTGLLVAILESGVPAPPLNANRHLSGCDCQECRMLAYHTCPYCGEYPCLCEEAED